MSKRRDVAELVVAIVAIIALELAVTLLLVGPIACALDEVSSWL